MQAVVSTEIHSSSSSKYGQHGSIAGEYKHSAAYSLLSTFLCLCIIHPVDLQCTKKAAKVRKVLPMYIHSHGLEFMYI